MARHSRVAGLCRYSQNYLDRMPSGVLDFARDSVSCACALVGLWRSVPSTLTGGNADGWQRRRVATLVVGLAVVRRSQGLRLRPTARGVSADQINGPPSAPNQRPAQRTKSTARPAHQINGPPSAENERTGIGRSVQMRLGERPPRLKEPPNRILFWMPASCLMGLRIVMAVIVRSLCRKEARPRPARCVWLAADCAARAGVPDLAV
jgi:hypothetical protein